MMKKSRTLLALALACGLPRVAAAQTDVPDRFRLEIGGFAVDAETQLRLSSERLPGDVVTFETDLSLPDNSQRVYLDAYWRAGRRHLLDVSYARLHRDGAGTTLQRDIVWGDTVFPVGVQATASVESDYLSGAYRFAIFRNEKVEVGPALGFGYLWIKAGITATGTIDANGNPISGAVDRERSKGQPTGNLGAYLYWWPARRVNFRTDLRYIIVKPGNSEASLTDARAALLFYPWRKVGIGASYLYNKFRYDRGILESEISGSYRYQGGQLLISFAF
jgi:hypothetical protein